MRHFLSAFCALTLAGWASIALAAPPPRALYADVMAREQAVRAALTAPDAPAALLPEVRAVVFSYESLVRHYPTSGYSDNALWQAARLSLDAYEVFHQQQDRDRAARLLRKLQTVYVNSSLVKQVPGQLERLAARRAEGDRDVEPASRERQAGSRREANTARDVREAAAARGEPLDPRPQPRPALSLTMIKSIRRAVMADAIRVTIELDGEVPFHDERIADPARVFVDLPGTRIVPALVDKTIRFESDADPVRQVRVGRHPNNTTRVVLDANGVSSYSVYPLYDPYRLVIDCVRDARQPTAVPLKAAATVPAAPAVVPASIAPPVVPPPAMPTPALDSRPTWSTMIRRAPSLKPRHSSLIASVAAETPALPTTLDAPPKIADLAPVAPIAPTTPPVRNMNGGFSIARQLGLGVARIVIDAGHGGHDPGAQGKGVSEAELVLDVALRVEKLLQNIPGIEVVLTRRTDEFIQLQERTAIANRVGADLFLSIHANASGNPQARGVETYFLNFANNLSAAAVAARENAASGQAMGALPDIVKAIALNNKLDESRDFATQVQRAMIERLRGTNKTVRDLGVKQAPFVVLIGAAMPSVLAEISFVTNTQEARLLKSSAYRQRIADALFNAIRKYQASLHVTTVATHQ